ncbi:MAG: hypothetical protein DRJ03_10360 [Chloroflexi bacterium]|nr:MAG: hypothetical protein DRI81_04580 [Chloroflexota bacterium]RLC85878.1 MAG: hypothetical protein DRJ03_10360 [Chloroflexota bacterium]
MIAQKNSKMSDLHPTLAYITQTYPALTNTFIYREVLALERRGFDIAAFAIWKPDKQKLSPESRLLVDTTTYVFPLRWGGLLKAHLRYLLNRPRKYLGTALFAFTRPGESLSNRKRTLGHFIEAIYLAPEMEQRGVRHIHAHFTINAASIALILARLLDISFSFTAHNIFFTDRLLITDKLREARFIVAISEFSRQYLMRLLPGEKIGDKIHIVHCGLQPQTFTPPTERPANDLPVILFVAQFAERKGAPYLVEACRILRDRGVRFRCVIIGGGPQLATVQTLVARHDLTNCVELTGPLFQEQLKPYLARADVFVLPCITAANGDMDGVPVSLMEAMATEIAVVSTTVSGIPELIQDDENGFLVPEKDSVALANVLRRLIEDPALRIRLGQNGRQKIVQEFDVHKNAEQLTILFERYVQ